MPSHNTGKAEYVTCDIDRKDHCWGSSITTQAGEDVALDVRINFVEGGSLLNQTVQFFQLNQETQPDNAQGSKTLYVCNQGMGSSCPEARDGSVAVIQEGFDMFDITVVIRSIEAGEYTFTASYGVVDPRTGGQTLLVKSFQVTALEQETSGDCKYM